jgi:hypothetical protein
MTGKFTLKRRKQAAPRPDGQNSQGALAALGIGIGRSSPHVGSKPGHLHLSDPRPERRFQAAQAWHKATGRPLPPQMRPRAPLAPPAALDLRGRAGFYTGMRFNGPAGPVTSKKLSTLTTPQLLDAPSLTPAQRRRLLRKAGCHGERPAGFKPAAWKAEQQRVAMARARGGFIAAATAAEVAIHARVQQARLTEGAPHGPAA